MADIKSSEARSYNMSRIRCKDTKPEEIVKKYLFSKGFRYRKNDKKLPGTRIRDHDNIEEKQVVDALGMYFLL